MLAGRPEPRPVHGPDHDGRDRLAAEHVAELGRLIEDLVETDAQEVHEHQFGHRPQPGRSGAYGGADEGAFGDRRIQHPVTAEFRHQPLGDAQHAAPGVVVAGSAHAAGHCPRPSR